MPFRPLVTACLLAGLTLLLYSFRLDDAPLSATERALLDQAQSIDKPQMFFHVQDDRWLQPIAVYATALVYAAGGGDTSGRIASAIVGAIDVALIFLAARVLFASTFAAIASAMLLLAMPAHWWFAREGTDAIFPVPFVLTWAIGMLHFIGGGSPRSLIVAGAALGVGMLAHPAAPLTMVWLWVVSVIAVPFAAGATKRAVVFLTAPLALVIAGITLHSLLYPEIYADTFGRWAVLKAHLRFPLDGLRAQVNWNTLGNRASTFWGLLDPSFLFFASENRGLAPLPVVCALLVPLGLFRVLGWTSASQRIVVLALFLVPPIIWATFGVTHDLSGAVAMTAGIALIAAAGVESLARRFRLLTT